MASCSMQSDAMSSSSFRVKTRPVGLFGVFTMIAFVRAENAARSSSGSKTFFGGRRGEIREALREVDAAMQRVQARHLSDDRLGEVLGARRKDALRGAHVSNRRPSPRD